MPAEIALFAAASMAVMEVEGIELDVALREERLEGVGYLGIVHGPRRRNDHLHPDGASTSLPHEEVVELAGHLVRSGRALVRGLEDGYQQGAAGAGLDDRPQASGAFHGVELVGAALDESRDRAVVERGAQSDDEVVVSERSPRRGHALRIRVDGSDGGLDEAHAREPEVLIEVSHLFLRAAAEEDVDLGKPYEEGVPPVDQRDLIALFHGGAKAGRRLQSAEPRAQNHDLLRVFLLHPSLVRRISESGP